MILIGEKLNSSIPSTMEKFVDWDEGAIIGLIEKQANAGADFLDINAAICGERELEILLWVIDLIKSHSNCGIMIDTADTSVMASAAKAAAGRDLILNSTTIDERFDEVIPLALEYGASVVALPIDQDGMPHTYEEKCRKIDILMRKLLAAGIPEPHIFLDILIETLSTDSHCAQNAIGALYYAMENYPGINSTCGLSNISFGLPRRALINSTFLTAAMQAGLTSAILDPCSPPIRDTLMAAQVVLGQDDYCMDYITYLREQDEQQ